MLTNQTQNPKIASTIETKNELERQEKVSINVDPRDIAVFLKFVAEGEQNKAEAMLQKNPALAFAPGDVIDLSKRRFNGITGFQYAIWALDWHMWKMIREYLPLEAAREQIQKLETASWVAQHGVHCSWQRLLDAMSELEEHVDKDSRTRNRVNRLASERIEEIDGSWINVIGGEQRLLPAHVIQEYCHPGRSFAPSCPTPSKRDSVPSQPDFTIDPFPREMKLYVSDNAKEPLDLSGLGVSFALYRHSSYGALVMPTASWSPKHRWWGQSPWPFAVVLKADRLSCASLLNTRIRQYENLVAELAPAREVAHSRFDGHNFPDQGHDIEILQFIEVIKKNNQKYFDNSCEVILPKTDMDGWVTSPTNYVTKVQNVYTSYSERIQKKKIQIQECAADSSTILSSILLSTTLENFDEQLKAFADKRKTPLNVLAHHAAPARIKGSDYLYSRLNANNQGVTENWTNRRYSIPLDVENILVQAKLDTLLLMGEMLGIIRFDLSYRAEVAYSTDADTKFDIYIDCIDEQQKSYELAIISVAGIIPQTDENLGILKLLYANHVRCCNTHSLSPLQYERSGRSHTALGMIACFPHVAVKKVEILPTVYQQFFPLLKNKVLDKIFAFQSSVRSTDLLKQEQVTQKSNFINKNDNAMNDLPKKQERPAQPQLPVTLQDSSNSITSTNPHILKEQKTYCPYFSRTALISFSVLAAGIALETGRRYYSKF